MFPGPGNYWFIFPWIAFIPWYGMLVAMLVCWAAQGHPIYWFMHTEQFPVYISHIGATNLKPLFISCAAWQGLGYVIMVGLEYFQRSGHWPFKLPYSYEDDMEKSNDSSSMKTNYVDALIHKRYVMAPFFTKHERNLVWASFVLGSIGELALLMCTIFSTNVYPKVHGTMVGIFCAFVGLSVICHSAQYFTMGRHYAVIHPLTSPEDLGKQSRWNKWYGHTWNKYTISGTAKAIWVAAAFVWAMCFACLDDRSVTACFEWLLAFWFGLYFIIVSIDWYIGGRYTKSKYFHQIVLADNLNYYKYNQLRVQ
ncbi:unnamed protein product [Kluyveromyces dobzhanskii CBS 2104]|uniref:WGS project CCBQ000000000 data, contig 00015 n=1 Tax=Kluyveromyces dobzhanskii CBS 2104 TaxID=1427455 RepID=A0A0A8LBB5_9SACH|nr:unnamed protein product [Kluyveromyces dobzhanskii CBS 2104]